MSDERNRRKTRVGIVLSDKMDKTVVVRNRSLTCGGTIVFESP